MITPISKIYEVSKEPVIEFATNALVLAVSKFVLSSFAENSASIYGRFCQSPSDGFGCFALNVNQVFCENIVNAIDQIGGVLPVALGILILNKVNSCVSNCITKIS